MPAVKHPMKSLDEHTCVYFCIVKQIFGAFHFINNQKPSVYIIGMIHVLPLAKYWLLTFFLSILHQMYDALNLYTFKSKVINYFLYYVYTVPYTKQFSPIVLVFVLCTLQ